MDLLERHWLPEEPGEYTSSRARPTAPAATAERVTGHRAPGATVTIASWQQFDKPMG
jgi:hypothetical protein